MLGDFVQKNACRMCFLQQKRHFPPFLPKHVTNPVWPDQKVWNFPQQMARMSENVLILADVGARAKSLGKRGRIFQRGFLLKRLLAEDHFGPFLAPPFLGGPALSDASPKTCLYFLCFLQQKRHFLPFWAHKWHNTCVANP